RGHLRADPRGDRGEPDARCAHDHGDRAAAGEAPGQPQAGAPAPQAARLAGVAAAAGPAAAGAGLDLAVPHPERAAGSRRPRRPAQGWTPRSSKPNERWAVDATRVFCGRDGWCHLTAIIDCWDRNIVGWRLSKTGVAKVAAATLEDALRSRKIDPTANELTLR